MSLKLALALYDTMILQEHLKTYLFSVAFLDHGAFATFMISLRHL